MSITAQHSRPITDGHRYGLQYYKKRKFGPGHLAWLAWEDWAGDILSRKSIDINRLSDAEVKTLIEAMKRLPDVAPEGQGILF